MPQTIPNLSPRGFSQALMVPRRFVILLYKPSRIFLDIPYSYSMDTHIFLAIQVSQSFQYDLYALSLSLYTYIYIYTHRCVISISIYMHYGLVHPILPPIFARHPPRLCFDSQDTRAMKAVVGEEADRGEATAGTKIGPPADRFQFVAISMVSASCS